MAWRSSGTTNDEMVDNLKRFRVINSAAVEAGFRSVDRKFFVPKNQLDLAHKDQPLKDGNVHLSAPHIYGSVLEALELEKDAAISFLNAGSGSGYLTCIAASILGPRSIHYGIEVHEDVIQHSRQAISAWQEAHPGLQNIQHIHMIHGNALELQTDKGECAFGFDRIYIGAAIESDHLPMFKRLLKPGGILVGPVDDELVKVVRSPCSISKAGDGFTVHIISAVRFAPLVPRPAIETVIPAKVWSPEEHMFYPDSFRVACKNVLLCSNARRKQPPKPQPQTTVNAASMLPRALWMEVLSYTHRDWFETSQNELDILRKRLAQEKANVERANEDRLEAERRRRTAEKERDVYRLLARRWKARLQASSAGEDIDNETIEEAAAAIFLGRRESVPIFGLGNMFRRFRGRASAVSRREGSHDDDDDNDQEEGELLDRSDRMEEDNENDYDMSEDTVGAEDDSSSDEDVDSLSLASSHQGSTVDVAGPGMKTLRPQARTVSLSEDDL